jgi:3D (Asp-Asp-Asp) domain-containing protein
MVYSYHNIRTTRTQILIDIGTQSIGGKVDLWMESNMQYLQKKSSFIGKESIYF